MLLKKEVFAFLKSYSADPIKINRIIVSTFLFSNEIVSTKNRILKELIISKNDPDYDALLELIKIQPLENFEQLIEAFEFVVSPEDKIVTGAVYTPEVIRDFIVQYTLSKTNIDNVTLCDPACGCAGFLYNAAKIIKKTSNKPYKTIFKDNIYGLDIQNYSVERSKLLLSLLALTEDEDEEIFNFNIWCGNALNFQWSASIENFDGFSIVLGNPPYVCSRNIDDESKLLLNSWTVCSTGHPDLYIPFFEIGLTNLKQGGILGFITMNTFFKSINGRALRDYFEKHSFKIRLIDFGGHQIFQSKSTYTCICLIENRPANGIEYLRIDKPSGTLNSLEFKFNEVPYSLLNSKDGWNLKDIDLVSKIELVGTPFGANYRTRNGIATLKNEVYIFKPVAEDDNFYILNQKGVDYPIEKGICRDIINPNKFTKPIPLNDLRKKIIFPYFYQNEQVKLIDETDFKNSFPRAYKYLSGKKVDLAKRDKNKANRYEKWYAFGRNQSLERFPYKLFFPHITPIIPTYVVNSDPDLLFYNGLAIIGKSHRELLLLQKLMSSKLFWFYIKNSSKPYGSGYYSLSRNYIKNFGVYNFTEEEIDQLINMEALDDINAFIEERYNITL